jgi:hypothetical protein
LLEGAVEEAITAKEESEADTTLNIEAPLEEEILNKFVVCPDVPCIAKLEVSVVVPMFKCPSESNWVIMALVEEAIANMAVEPAAFWR